jgi:hypothetical protein
MSIASDRQVNNARCFSSCALIYLRSGRIFPRSALHRKRSSNRLLAGDPRRRRRLFRWHYRPASPATACLRRGETQFSRAETKTPKRSPQFQWEDCRDKMRVRIAASLGLFALIRGNLRLRRTAWWGWRTRTSSPTIIDRSSEHWATDPPLPPKEF